MTLTFRKLHLDDFHMSNHFASKIFGIFFVSGKSLYLHVCISVPVCSIKEVRSGKTTEALKNKEIAGIYPDECAFSIVFGDNFESMDLIANTPDEANIWVTGLTCLINTNARSMTCKYQTRLCLLPFRLGTETCWCCALYLDKRVPQCVSAVLWIECGSSWTFNRNSLKHY